MMLLFHKPLKGSPGFGTALWRNTQKSRRLRACFRCFIGFFALTDAVCGLLTGLFRCGCAVCRRLHISTATAAIRRRSA